MRVRVKVPVKLVVQADTAQLALTFDGLISRNRELVKTSPILAVALARLSAQLTYRLASERWREDGRFIEFIIELTKDELEALAAYSANVLFNINAAIRYYKEVLRTGKARSKASVEAKIAALEFVKIVIEQLVRAVQ